MALKKPCISCGVLATQSPCRKCATNKFKRPGYDNHERLRRKRAVELWINTNGRVCPGFEVPAHPSNDLTADHVRPVAAGGAENGPLAVLCRPCNSRKGARL